MAFGFRPIRHGRGGTVRLNSLGTYSIASGYGTALYRGDLVKRAADGTLVKDTAGSTLTVGVFWGVEYVDSVSGEVKYSPYWPASTTATNIKAYIYDDPDIIFEAVADQDTTGVTSSDIGEFVDAVASTASGSSVTKVSGMQLDSSTVGTSPATFMILGSREVDGVFTGATTATGPIVLEVMFAEHALKAAPLPTATG